MTKLYIFVGIWDGVVDQVSLHMTEKETEQAYANFTGVPYVNPITDEVGPPPSNASTTDELSHTDHSTIEDIDIPDEQLLRAMYPSGVQCPKCLVFYEKEDISNHMEDAHGISCTDRMTQ